MTATQHEREGAPLLSSRLERRESNETDRAFVRVAQVLWTQYGMTGEVMHLVQEGELLTINPESVDDEGREFLIELLKHTQ